MRNCFEFLGSMQMIRKLLLFAGIVKVTAASRDYGQRLVINWDVLLVPATRRVVIVTVGIISGGISAGEAGRWHTPVSHPLGDPNHAVQTSFRYPRIWCEPAEYTIERAHDVGVWQATREGLNQATAKGVAVGPMPLHRHRTRLVQWRGGDLRGVARARGSRKPSLRQ